MKRLTRDRKKKQYLDKFIRCSRCGLPGGTLVKEGDHYRHQDAETCRLLQLRRRNE